MRFRQRRVGTLEMEDAEVDRHRVEGAIGERQRFGVTFLKRQRRILLRRQRDHFRREVDPDRRRAQLRGFCGDVPRTRRHVEQALPRSTAAARSSAGIVCDVRLPNASP